MRILKCYECGHIFKEEDAGTRSENVGEFWGAPAYMDFNVCPECDSDEIDEFEYPCEECEDFKGCNFDCENCELKDKEEH